MAKRTKTLAEAVSDSRKNTGAVQTTLTLKPGEAELLDRMAERHGGKKAAIIAGLCALDAGDNQKMTKAALLAEIERRLK